MKTFWPITTPKLPIDETQEVLLRAVFLVLSTGVRATIYDGPWMVDIINGHDFQTVYDTVSREYPQAGWDPEENK